MHQIQATNQDVGESMPGTNNQGGLAACRTQQRHRKYIRRRLTHLQMPPRTSAHHRAPKRATAHAHRLRKPKNEEREGLLAIRPAGHPPEGGDGGFHPVNCSIPPDAKAVDVKGSSFMRSAFSQEPPLHSACCMATIRWHRMSSVAATGNLL